MKWKSNVTVERENQYIFRQDAEGVIAAKEDYYIIDAVEQGIIDDKELINLVSKTEQVSDVIAAFRLAQFILDYGDFISNDVGHMIIQASQN